MGLPGHTASPVEPVRRSKFMGLGRWGGEGKSNFVMSDASGWANLIVGSAPNSSFSSEIPAALPGSSVAAGPRC